MSKLLTLGLALASGVLSVWGWAPFGWWGLPLLGYGMLFWLLCASRTARWAGCLGLAFGIGLPLAGHGCIMNTLHDTTGMALLPAAAGTLVFILYLALFSAIPCFIWRLAAKPATAAGDTMPGLAGRLAWLSAIGAFAAWLTHGEWARSLLF